LYFQPAVPIRIISLNSIGRTLSWVPSPLLQPSTFSYGLTRFGARFAVVRWHLLGMTSKSVSKSALADSTGSASNSIEKDRQDLIMRQNGFVATGEAARK
jgi:hypothetical protein